MHLNCTGIHSVNSSYISINLCSLILCLNVSIPLHCITTTIKVSAGNLANVSLVGPPLVKGRAHQTKQMYARMTEWIEVLQLADCTLACPST